jgi:5-oxoprolinase (ATP-hydrolysing) subunit A
MKIDINSDMGEGFGRYRVADDAALMEVVSSVNVACGFHAGDPSIMASTVRTAKERNLGLGAHPGLPDLMGFGRRTMAIDAEEMTNMLIYQLGALQGFAAAAGYPVTHVSYHAAFGNMALADRALADALTSAIKAVDRDLVVYSMPDTEVERSARAAGLRTMQLFLADRAYRADGSLVPRGLSGAVMTSADDVAARVQRFLDSGTVVTIEGESIPMRARSILIHSDTPGSAELARRVRGAVEDYGATVAPAHTFAE